MKLVMALIRKLFGKGKQVVEFKNDADYFLSKYASMKRDAEKFTCKGEIF